MTISQMQRISGPLRMLEGDEKKKACFEMRKCCWRLCSDVCRQAVALQRPLVFGMTKTATSGVTASGLKKKNSRSLLIV